MAKRRNLKKEKALRNEEYARKFRKRGQGGSRRRHFGSGNRPPASSSDQNDNTEAGESSSDKG